MLLARPPTARPRVGALLAVAALLACVPPVEAMEVSPEQVVEVKAGVTRNILPEHRPPNEGEWDAVCDNYEKLDWDHDVMMDRLRDQHGYGSNRPVVIHSLLLVWLGEVMDHPDPAKSAPSLIKGFCETHREGNAALIIPTWTRAAPTPALPIAPDSPTPTLPPPPKYADCPTAAEEAYFAKLELVSLHVANHGFDVSDMFEEAAEEVRLFRDDDWKRRITLALSGLDQTAADIRGLAPPPGSAGEIHAVMDMVADALSEAVVIYTRGLDYLDPDTMAVGDENIYGVVELMDLVSVMRWRFCEVWRTPPSRGLNGGTEPIMETGGR